MEQVETDEEEPLGAWRQDWRHDLYLAVRAPMRQAASQGIASITASKADPQDVENAVYNEAVRPHRGKQIHMVLRQPDHARHPRGVRAWLQRNPHVTFHFTRSDRPG